MAHKKKSNSRPSDKRLFEGLLEKELLGNFPVNEWLLPPFLAVKLEGILKQNQKHKQTHTFLPYTGMEEWRTSF